MAKRRPQFDALEQRLCLTGTTLQTTFSLPTGSWTPTVYRASPIFVDIFGTGKSDLIAVASGAQLVAYAENADGSASPVVTYKVPGGVADIKSTPIVLTDPTTGRQDLFAAMGRNEAAGTLNGGSILEDGRVFGWDLKTGNVLPAFANGVSTGSQPNGETGVYGALTSGYLQNNGMPDIVVTSFSHEVTAITLQGTILWQWDNDDSIISSAVVADIGRDGSPEVVVGGDSSASPYFQNGGWVTVLNNTGQLLWRRQILGEVTWSSPVVADLLNNGQLDIVIGTGDNFSSTLGGAYTAAGDYIYAFDPFGNMLPGWPYHTTFTGDTTPHEVLASPAVADLTGSGLLDVVTIDRAGYLHVVQPNGTDLPGFAGGKRINPEQTQATTADDYASPVIADINGDGKPDIIATAGLFINAFDSSGNMIPIGTTPNGSGGLPEGVDSAPAIGNFDGSGGLCMAVVSWDANQSNRPDQVQIYQLPQSTLTPPWPFLRRTITGDAVARSPVYDQGYVAESFATLMGSLPSTATLKLYANALNSDSINLLSTAQLIAGSLPVEQSEVAKIYQAFLGHAPDASALSYWSTYLNSNTYRQMESAVASSAEFAQRAGGSLGQEVVQLYQAILSRVPSTAEKNAWVGTNLPASTIATLLLNSTEGVTDQFNTVVQAMFGAGTQGLLPADALATYSYDLHTGMSETQLISLTLTSNGNLATTNFVAGYVQNLYRDLLFRTASHSDIAYWVSSVDNGTVAFGNIATAIFNSTEAKQDFVQNEFLALLGHGADAGTLATLANLPSRQAVLIFIIGSQEYFAKNGGNNTSFVVAAFRDLGGFDVTQFPATLSGTVAQLNAGTATQSTVAASIIYNGGGASIYFSNLVVNELEYYIPLESQGVLRSGELPTNAAGQPINPDPSLIAYFEGLYSAGYSDAQVLSIMLNSPQYYTQAAYNRGLYRTPFVRY